MEIDPHVNDELPPPFVPSDSDQMAYSFDPPEHQELWSARTKALMLEAARSYLDDNGRPWWHPRDYATSNLRILGLCEIAYMEEVNRRWPEPWRGQRRPMATMQIPIIPDPGQPCVYRHFDNARALLYAGVTSHFIDRQNYHRANAQWWDEVARIDVVLYDNREDAADAERHAIRSEEPLYNIQYR